jgi:hypothetical protein
VVLAGPLYPDVARELTAVSTFIARCLKHELIRRHYQRQPNALVLLSIPVGRDAGLVDTREASPDPDQFVKL